MSRSTEIPEQDDSRSSTSGIVAGSGEGIPTDGTSANGWHAVLWATCLIPMYVFQACSEGRWLNAVALSITLVSPLFVIRKLRPFRIGNGIWLSASLIVSGANGVSYLLALPLQQMQRRDFVSLAEVQILLSLCYACFGAWRSLRRPE